MSILFHWPLFKTSGEEEEEEEEEDQANNYLLIFYIHLPFSTINTLLMNSSLLLMSVIMGCCIQAADTLDVATGAVIRTTAC